MFSLHTQIMYELKFYSFNLNFYRGVIRGQLNLEQHDVNRCTNMSNKWGTIDECPMPEFYSPKSEVGRTFLMR